MGYLVSVILPCRNEEKTVGDCIRKIKRVFSDNKIEGEIIVSDSSTDGSAEIAWKLGAVVVKHGKEGYGYAYQEGFKRAKGDIIIIGDADGTYDFMEIPKLLAKAKENGKANDIVIGSRLKGTINKGAMPWLHRRIGNPVLSGLLRMLFGSNVSDTQSGFRMIKRDAWKKLNLQTGGMEFASEMIIRATKQGMKIAEVPISYYPRKKGSESKLRSFWDAWKHIRFMLLYSHAFLFMIPGLLLFLGGVLLSILSDQSTLTTLASVLMLVLGYQLLLLGVFAKTYASVHLKQRSRMVDWMNRYVSLEKGILLGVMVVALSGVLLFMFELFQLSVIFMILGVQTLFAAFFLSIIGIEER